MTNVDFARVEFAFVSVNHFFFRDPLNNVEAGDLKTVPLAGQPGHGVTSSMRRQLIRIVDGRREGGCRDAYAAVCCDRGDHPYWDYSEISGSLQRIRGPYTTMAAALATYEQHVPAAHIRKVMPLRL